MSCTNTTRNNNVLNERGSAIALVVAVGAVVTLMVFAWVAFSVQRSHAVIEKRDGLHARYAAESVISKAIYGQMVHPRDSAARDTTMIFRRADTSLSGDSVSNADTFLVYYDTLHRSRATASITEEGSYLQVKAEGVCRNASCTIDARFGYLLPSPYHFALILAEQNKRLEIRKGKIIGDAWLAQQPEGRVEGKIETGVASLPAVDDNKIKAGVQRLEEKMRLPEKAETVLQGAQVFSEKSLPLMDSGKNLFVNGNVLIENTSNAPFHIKGPLSIIAAGAIQISGRVVMDNVELLATDRINCFDNTRLQNATLFSMTTIGLDNDVRCSGELYAFEKIVLTGNAAVEMPAFAFVRGVLKGNETASDCGIHLDGESRFSGTAFCEQGFTYSSIGREAQFLGLFYTRGYLAVYGIVSGCVAAQRMKKDLSSDGNEFAGGTINRKTMPKNFTVPCAFGKVEGAQFKLVSWNERMSFTKTKDASDE